MPLTSSSMFQVLTQLLQCNRRAPKSTATGQYKSNVKFHDESTKARKYRELSDVSTTDDASDQHGTYQSDDSEQTDFPTTYMRGPPGLAPPPGLSLRPGGGQSHEFANSSFKQPKQTMTWGRVWQRAGGPAAADAPWRMEQGGRRPTAFDQPSPNAVKAFHRRNQKQADTFAALKDALDKLAPTEIEAVRSLLDSKAGSAGAGTSSHPWNNAVGSGRPHRPANANPLNRKPDMNDVDTGESVQTFLKELAVIDDARVVSVRKINALGFGSAPLLQDYFSKFGTVDRVMVAPSVVCGNKVNRACVSAGKSRARPAGLGFVVMQTSEEVQAILKHGETHSLAGVDIKACPFQSHSVAATD